MWYNMIDWKLTLEVLKLHVKHYPKKNLKMFDVILSFIIDKCTVLVHPVGDKYPISEITRVWKQTF